jgi:hypothetical protein
MPNDLTQKQEAFCLAYIETGNASEAYRRAYNAAKMKNESIRVKASELLANGNVTVRIAELRKAAEGKALVSLADHMGELAAVRDQAKEAKQFGPAIKAEELRGRLSGLYSEQPLQPSPKAVSQPGKPDGPVEDTLAPMFDRFLRGLKPIEDKKAKPTTGNGNGHGNGNLN